MEWRGKPKVIRCDNGPEYLSTAIVTWTQKLGIGWNTLSRASRNRTRTSNGSIGPRDTNGSRNICGKTWSRFGRQRPTGCGLTITSANMALGGEAAAGHGRLVSTSADCGKRGITRAVIFLRRVERVDRTDLLRDGGRYVRHIVRLFSSGSRPQRYFASTDSVIFSISCKCLEYRLSMSRRHCIAISLLQSPRTPRCLYRKAVRQLPASDRALFDQYLHLVEQRQGGWDQIGDTAVRLVHPRLRSRLERCNPPSFGRRRWLVPLRGNSIRPPTARSSGWTAFTVRPFIVLIMRKAPQVRLNAAVAPPVCLPL